MVAHEVMRQFMTQNHPPIHQGVLGVLALQKTRFMQLLEVKVIAEDTASPVEGDRFPTGVIEDTHRVDPERKHVRAFDEDRSKCVDTCAVLRDEVGPVRETLCEQQVDSTGESRDEVKIVARFFVAV